MGHSDNSALKGVQSSPGSADSVPSVHKDVMNCCVRRSAELGVEAYPSIVAAMERHSKEVPIVEGCIRVGRAPE